MSREKDFIEAAERLAETKRTEDAKQQCLYDFGIAADYGYQYAIDKACEWLKTNAYDYTRFEYLPESDYPQADVDVCKMVKDLRKAMEE